MNYYISILLSLSLALCSSVANASELRAEMRAGHVDTELDVDGIGKFDTGSGLSYGMAIGYDFDLGSKIFAGPEVSVDLADASAIIAGEKISQGRQIAVSVRIGAKFGESVKVYGLVGRANSRIKTNIGSDTGNGSVFGGGLQLSLSKNLFAKGEFRRLTSDVETDLSATGKLRDQRAFLGVGLRF